MPAPRDNDVIPCLSCGGEARECLWCHETGVMNARQRRRFEHFEMVRTSGTHELYRRSAEDLAARLDRWGTPESHVLAQEAHRLAATFAAWRQAAPSSQVRKQSIEVLFEFQRRALEFMTSGWRP